MENQVDTVSVHLQRNGRPNAKRASEHCPETIETRLTKVLKIQPINRKLFLLIVENSVSFDSTVQLGHLFEMQFVIGFVAKHTLFISFKNWYHSSAANLMDQENVYNHISAHFAQPSSGHGIYPLASSDSGPRNFVT